MLYLGSATPSEDNRNASTYEYIVVGSGPGGGPLAANLARRGHSVLLLEAGDQQPNNEASQNVYNNTPAINDPLTRWDYFVTRDLPEIDEQYELTTWRQTDGEFYVGLNPPEGAERLGVYYPRAGTVGGCAMHNNAAISLPADADWQAIADVTGDSSWTVANMRQYLIRLERNLYIRNGTDTSHGFNGYLDTSASDASWAKNASSSLTRLAQSLSDSLSGDNSTDSSLFDLLNRDVNILSPDRDNLSGLYTSHTHSNNGVRSSPLQYIRATLADAKNFPLTLQEHTLVTKVLFDNNTNNNTHSNPKAIGVEYLRGQSLYSADPRHNPSNPGVPGKAFATKEIILAAGAFNTPQILKLSGLGPADELSSLSIPLVKHLPGVGINMHDNYEGVLYGTFSPAILGNWGMFFKTSRAVTRDIFFYCGNFNWVGFYPGMPANNTIPGEFECGFIHLHPRSINGTVKLRSRDPRDVPEVHLGVFRNEGDEDEDLKAMLEAVEFVRSAFRNLEGNTFTEMKPCGLGVKCTEEYQRKVLRGQVFSHHASGSCAIGSENDPFAVLDGKFRVRGVEGLRVVDGSAFPVQAGELPVLSTFMLGEKALDAILEVEEERREESPY